MLLKQPFVKVSKAALTPSPVLAEVPKCLAPNYLAIYSPSDLEIFLL